VPNSLVPTINLLAVNIGWLIGGTVVVETVFALPGMGQLLVRAIFSRDYMVVQGVAMVFACATVLVNFLADIVTVDRRSEGDAMRRDGDGTDINRLVEPFLGKRLTLARSAPASC
jgi:ABC-type microcin C transport system permease subunit YejB